jgi:hypothetical protein
MRWTSGVIPHAQAELHDHSHQRHGRSVAVECSAGNAGVDMSEVSLYTDSVELRWRDGHPDCPEPETPGIQAGQRRMATRRRTRHGSQE